MPLRLCFLEELRRRSEGRGLELTPSADVTWPFRAREL